jgi:hypothetical protein
VGCGPGVALCAVRQQQCEAARCRRRAARRLQHAAPPLQLQCRWPAGCLMLPAQQQGRGGATHDQWLLAAASFMCPCLSAWPHRHLSAAATCAGPSQCGPLRATCRHSARPQHALHTVSHLRQSAPCLQCLPTQPPVADPAGCGWMAPCRRKRAAASVVAAGSICAGSRYMIACIRHVRRGVPSTTFRLLPSCRAVRIRSAAPPHRRCDA